MLKAVRQKFFLQIDTFSKFDKLFVNATQRFLEKTPKHTKN